MLNYLIHACTFRICLWDIKEYFERGVWVTFNQWLQRLEQQKRWTTEQKRKAKSYLETLLQTEGQLEGFLTCEIDFLISDLEKKQTQIFFWQFLALLVLVEVQLINLKGLCGYLML